MCIIFNSFTSEIGENFDNIRDIHFSSPGAILTELGSPIYESDGFNSPDQVKIYRLPGVADKALRIDKNFLNYWQLYRNDDIFVSMLQDRQKDVSLTEFPTGIVTIENKVIGQEIPFYDKTVTIDTATKTRKIATWEDSLSKSLEILKIIRELLNAGIIYQDIHAGNFLYNLDTGQLNLIDFDSRFVKFDYHKYAYNSMISNLKTLIELLNKRYRQHFNEDFDNLYRLEDIDDYIQTEYYKVLRRKVN